MPGTAPEFRFPVYMALLNMVLAALAFLSLGLLVWQWLAARRFPLHRRIEQPGFAPAVSILKPLKGCDETTADSLRSWFNQNYTGPIQILFAVTDANDPVVKIVRQLIAENPKNDAQLLIYEKLAGANAKAAKLAQLEILAKHDLILVSDADVRVPMDFLLNFVAPLRDEKAGLVNCFYRLANPATTAMQWEAVAINADFWSQVLQSQTLKPLDFALGAAILVRRKALEETGGFKALADCLADDYLLGNRVAKNNHRIALCTVVVECWDPPMGWLKVWKHQLRWARTIRVCQPLPYFLSILSNAGFWALLWFFISLAAGRTFYAPSTAIVFLLLRTIIAHNLQSRFTPDRKLISPFWLVPLKDLLQAAIWFGAFLGNTIEWRGRKMKLRRDGTLEMVGAEGFEPPTNSV
jgi:ceramide glucosyltransferase